MFVTFEVLKEDRSRDASDVQAENMYSIDVTFEVSKDDRSRDASDVQKENMEPIDVT